MGGWQGPRGRGGGLLLEYKADIDSKDRGGRTPLSWAVEKGHEVVTKPLLEMSKVDVDLKDRYGRTSPRWAVEGGYRDMFRLLQCSR